MTGRPPGAGRSDLRLIGLLFLAGLLAAAQFAKIALELPALAERYPGAPVPLLVSALSVTGIVLGTAAGGVVARIGPRRALLWALAAGAAISALQAGLPAFPAMLLLRLAEGGAHLAIVVAAPTLMAQVAAPRDVPVAMGLWGTFFGVGFALSAVAVDWLVTPRAVFLAHAAGLLLLAAALWPLLPRVVPAVAPLRDGWVARHRAIYTTPWLIAPALGFIWHTSIFLGLLTFLPGFLGAWTGAILPLAALVGTIGAGVAARRVRPLRLVQIGLGLSALALLALWACPETARGITAIPVFAVLGIVPGASFAAVPDLNAAPADRARANGAMAQLGNCGTALSTPIFAASVAWGIGGPLALAAAVTATGLIVVTAIRARAERNSVTGPTRSGIVP